MEQLRTIGQNKRLFGLLQELGLTDQRAELALQYSNKRTERTSQLYYSECAELIKDLEGSQEQEEDVRFVDAEGEAAKNMRRKFFAICHELKWKKNGKLDYDRINAWLLKYGYLHQKINDYEYDELPELISQIEKVLKYKNNGGKDKNSITQD